MFEALLTTGQSKILLPAQDMIDTYIGLIPPSITFQVIDDNTENTIFSSEEEDD